MQLSLYKIQNNFKNLEKNITTANFCIIASKYESNNPDSQTNRILEFFFYLDQDYYLQLGYQQ